MLTPGLLGTLIARHHDLHICAGLGRAQTDPLSQFGRIALPICLGAIVCIHCSTGVRLVILPISPDAFEFLDPKPRRVRNLAAEIFRESVESLPRLLVALLVDHEDR